MLHKGIRETRPNILDSTELQNLLRGSEERKRDRAIIRKARMIKSRGTGTQASFLALRNMNGDAHSASTVKMQSPAQFRCELREHEVLSVIRAYTITGSAAQQLPFKLRSQQPAL